MKEKLAINGGPKAVNKEFLWPIFDAGDVNAVTRIAQSGKWGNPDCGDEVAKFEEEFAAYCGAKYAITCVNGSVSLRLALIACDVKPGDEVIVPPYTFITTASSVIECNCVPVFVDIDPNTYNISPAAIEAAITERTKAIIPVHFGGLACDMDAIMDIARKHGLRVIEDAAHGHGAEYKGKKLGSIGDVGSFSFQSSKNLTSGEGGIVITNDDELYAMMRSLRNVGRIEGGQWYDHYNPGCNYRITQIQAVLLSQQLKRLEAQTRKRNDNGLYLNHLLSKVKGISPLSRNEAITLHCYHIYIFKYDPAAFGGLSRNDFAAMLTAEGVPSFKGYPHPLYKQPLFQNKNFMCYAIPDHVDYTQVYCPNAEQACSSDAVWILQHALLGEKEDMEAFVNAILKIQTSQL
ncbi:DegT/DnrJ/EryC1/StrS family aminotransferase [Dyadobacter chenwenxiniae]|uniref:DegT/DnrJ/EryC1/StrS family aminotransferase n=1 Tax=Dyadobacter chenwenxiniae TaxID=2906456 RepID=A0A9X1PMK9_9BACT|nr:DegT/DnrJ/EryC1/StrS family aminotransferase [Dyadobacter chenwenxiniae]MCF0063900.1 DegT/DnrJ/EryC1/StrS family aminotransferase [Dyadobacter chenwenxiniae]UON86426.1 DegT/DnrJ/EryC1/StrS family aminotransferase [Dyadobacter chenwenxiniae]